MGTVGIDLQGRARFGTTGCLGSQLRSPSCPKALRVTLTNKPASKGRQPARTIPFPPSTIPSPPRTVDPHPSASNATPRSTLSFHVYPFGVHVKSCSFYEPKRPIRKMIMNLRTFRFLKTRNRNITSICEKSSCCQDYER